MAKSAFLFLLVVMSSSSFAMSEWTWHRSPDGAHPNSREQQLIWLMNRARQDPKAEGEWLAESSDSDVSVGRIQWSVSRDILKEAFAAIPPQPPAVFDVRLYLAAIRHGRDLIARDAQDHDGQLEHVWSTGFNYSNWRGNVYAYADNPLNAHAAFNIDWGFGPNGMQSPPGHRIAIMSADGGGYSNVGISVTRERDVRTGIGDWVIVGNFARAVQNNVDHFNNFITGTVWNDLNLNGVYDINEGVKDVIVYPSIGDYYAVTSEGGGYAFPITEQGEMLVSFSGGNIAPTRRRIVVRNNSKLVDLVFSAQSSTEARKSAGTSDAFLELGVRDTQKFGNNYEEMVSSGVTVEFAQNRSDMVLSVDGYDIDNSTELLVYLNEQLIGGMINGPNDGVITSEFSIPALRQQEGTNIITFVPTDPSSTWGVSAMRLRDVTGPVIVLNAGIRDESGYGYGFGSDSHMTVLRRVIYTDGNTNLRIRARGYNAFVPDAVQTYFNGKHLGSLTSGGRRQSALPTYFDVAAADTVAGYNQLEFHFKRLPGLLWGVTKIEAKAIQNIYYK